MSPASSEVPYGAPDLMVLKTLDPMGCAARLWALAIEADLRSKTVAMMSRMLGESSS